MVAIGQADVVLTASAVIPPQVGRPSPSPRLQRGIRGAARPIVAAVVAVVTYVALVDPWRAIEAALVSTTLHAVGIERVSRVGTQLVGVSREGPMFLADIEALCSSIGPVLTFTAIAAVVRRPRTVRARAALRASAVVVACNLVRMSATVWVGMAWGPGRIEAFHDQVATAFTVVFVLTAGAVFVVTLWPSRSSRALSSSSSTSSSKIPLDRLS